MWTIEICFVLTVIGKDTTNPLSTSWWVFLTGGMTGEKEEGGMAVEAGQGAVAVDHVGEEIKTVL